MEEPATVFEPTRPLRLRWVTEATERPVWTAYDGPWRVGSVMDHGGSSVRPYNRFRWQVSILANAHDPMRLAGMCATAREAAELTEAGFFHCLPKASSIAGRLEDVMAYYAFLGWPLPPEVEHRRRREIEGENLLPFTPARGALALWGDEERRRGRRGLLTPDLMRETYGEDWRARMT